jgi:hypothetical protein
MKYCIAMCITFLLAASLSAQEVSPQVISSAGEFNVSSDNSISLSWTLGELVISTVTSTDNQLVLTQGFQQSNLIADAIKVHPELGITITVYPNPTSELVNIRLASPLEGNTMIYLTSPDGREVFNDKLMQGDLTMQISMHEYPSGTYFLRIQNGIKLNVYKIIKL